MKSILELSDKTILLSLVGQEKCLNKKQICKITSLNANTVHASIKRLIQRKLVTLHPSPMRSSCKIEINPPGLEIAHLVKIILSIEQKIDEITDNAEQLFEIKIVDPILN